MLFVNIVSFSVLNMHFVSAVWGKRFEYVVQALPKSVSEMENTSRDGPKLSLIQSTPLT